MFVRLTRRMRAKAGWFVALLYLFCVLAPGAALALGDAAPCFPTESTPAVTHMHEHSAHVGASHEHGGHQADAGHAKHTHDGKTSDGKTSPGPCCVMLCLSAIPANLPDIRQPAAADLGTGVGKLSAAAGQGAPAALSSPHRLT